MERLQSRSVIQWNTAPGALSVLPEFAQHDSQFPFYWRRQRHPVTDLPTTGHLVNGTVTTRRLVAGSDTSDLLPAPWFTALVYVTTQGPVTSSSVVYRLVKTLGRSSHLRKVCMVLLLLFFVRFYTVGWAAGRASDL